MNTEQQRLIDQIIDLETKVAYQEDTVQTLNDVITTQQQDIMQLKRQMTLLLDEVRNVLADAESGDVVSLADERPPHY
jgi:SlyX protein